MSNKRVIAKLVILMGTQTGEIALEKSVLIGQGPDVDIVLHDSRLDPRHCALEYTQGNFYLKDLESRTGSFVNHKKVTHCKLQDGDHIEIGNHLFRFEVVCAAGARARASAAVSQPASAQPATHAKRKSSSRAAKHDEAQKARAADSARVLVAEDLDDIKQIGPYKVLEELGRGGFGRVFRVKAPDSQQELALKILLAKSPAHLTRFKREIQTLAKLHHENIVEIIDVGEYKQHPYYTMELIEGRSLEQVIAEEDLTQREILEIVAAIANTLHAAHQKNIVHQDVTAKNIILQNKVPKIIDFGIVKDAVRKEHLTQSGEVIGTPHYMSPEQASGEVAAIDARSDIYSLGVILYQMLTKELPFKGESAANVMFNIIHEEPTAPRTYNPSIDILVEAICLKAMAKKPEDRYQTASAMANDIENFLQGRSVVARPLTALRKGLRTARKVKVLIYGLLLTLAMIVLISLVYLNQARRYHMQVQARMEILFHKGEDQLMANDNPVAAEFYYRCLLDLMPNNAKALKRLNEIVARRKAKAQKHLNRAYWYQQQKNPAGTIRELLIALYLDPKLSKAREMLQMLKTATTVLCSPPAQVKIYKAGTGETAQRPRFQGQSPLKFNEKGPFLFVVEKTGYLPLVFVLNVTNAITHVQVSLTRVQPGLESMLAIPAVVTSPGAPVKVQVRLLVDREPISREEYQRFHRFSGLSTAAIPGLSDAQLYAQAYGKRLATVEEWHHVLLPFCKILNYAPAPYSQILRCGIGEWSVRQGQPVAVVCKQGQLLCQGKAQTFRCVLEPDQITNFLRKRQQIEEQIKQQHHLILKQERAFHQFLEDYRLLAQKADLPAMTALCQRFEDNIAKLLPGLQETRSRVLYLLTQLKSIPANLSKELKTHLGQRIFLTRKGENTPASGVLKQVQGHTIVLREMGQHFKVDLAELAADELLRLLSSSPVPLQGLLALALGTAGGEWSKALNALPAEQRAMLVEIFPKIKGHWFFSKIQAEKAGQLFWSSSQDDWLSPQQANQQGFVYIVELQKWLKSDVAQKRGYGYRQGSHWYSHPQARAAGFIYLRSQQRWILSVKYWSQRPQRRLLYRKIIPDHFCFNRNGTLLAAGDYDGVLHLWQTNPWRLLTQWSGHKELITWVGYTPPGCWWTVGWDGTLRSWQRHDNKVVRTKALVSVERIHAAAINPNHRYALIADGQQLICWGLALGKAVKKLQGHQALIQAVAWHPKEKLAATGDQSGKIIIWNIEQGTVQQRWSAHKGAVFNLVFTPDGERLISGGADGKVRVWRLAGHQELCKLTDLFLKVHSLALTSDGRVLAGAGSDGKICLWEVSSGRRLQVLAGHHEPVSALRFSPDRKLLLSGGEDRLIFIWQPQP